jgi:CheY-like chemotaxis protein
VVAVTDPGRLLASARQQKPLVILADVVSSREDICGTIARLRQDRQTQHIPVIAFAPDQAADIQEAARQAGATLVVSDSAVLNHLPQFLEQALQVE